LIRVDRPGIVAEYHYDALGRRIEKVVNGVSTRYIYDNEDIVVEVDGTGTAQAFYLHGPGIDEPLFVARFGAGGGTSVFHADGLGSITTLTNPSGATVRSYTYDSFGRIVAQTGTVTNPYTYTSRELDPESGLFYYRARYYDSSTGRFLREDPVGGLLQRPLLLNPYAYVGSNPINNVDPDGQVLLEATLLFLAGQAAAIAIAYVGVKLAQLGANLAAKLACRPERIESRDIDKAFTIAAIASVTPAAKLAIIEVGLAGPAVVTSPVITNPRLIQEASDFVQGALVPGPPPLSGGGAAGFGARLLIEELRNESRQ
jgi:RHS repeat-associated protein